MKAADLPMTAIAYKLKQLRNRFYDMGDDYGVTMCDNLAEDLEVTAANESEGGESDQSVA